MNDLFLNQKVELDANELKMLQHGLHVLIVHHSGQYKERVEILSKKLWARQQQGKTQNDDRNNHTWIVNNSSRR